MRKSAVVLFVGLACVFLAPASVRADLTSEVYFGDEAPQFAVSFRGSLHTISGIDAGAGSFFGGDLDFDSDYGYGFSAEYYITPSISIELAFDHVNLNDTFLGARTIEVSLNDWALSGKYTFLPNARLRPYVLAGVDNLRSSFDIGETGILLVNGEINSTWGWHIGAGAEYRFTDNLGLFAEVRYRSGDADLASTQWFSGIPAATTVDTIEYDGICATVGLKIYW